MQIFVTSRGERNFESIVGYIKNKWGDRAAKHFIEKTDNTFKLLKNYPSMGQIEKGEIRDSSSHLRPEYFTQSKTKRL